MINLNKFFSKIRLVKINDFKHLFIFPLALFLSFFKKKSNQKLILICEDGVEARDNGYWLYKYIVENDSEAHVKFVISRSSSDYNKISKLGISHVEFGTLEHWVNYLSAGVNVSTHKGGKPNAAICYFFEVFGIWHNKRIFLQHGITISEAEWLYFTNTRMRGFICGAEPEYKAVLDTYGYPEGHVKYLGFPRFDQLHQLTVNKKRILVMPSWRSWLVLNTTERKLFLEDHEFKTSEYFKCWSNFLTNKKLVEFLETNELELIFYPHRNIQEKLHMFQTYSNNIILASWKEYDIQELLKSSVLLITDYSSVCMDFGYMKKASLYYQFDQEKFRIGQYKKGYFDYDEDGFGEVYTTEEEIIEGIINSYRDDFELDSKYKNRIESFFTLYDTQNSHRNYQFIKEVLND
ncbi:TPA: CDP-glycerol glycerophosphotransferase family protein [Streptococcus suis]